MSMKARREQMAMSGFNGMKSVGAFLMRFWPMEWVVGIRLFMIGDDIYLPFHGRGGGEESIRRMEEDEDLLCDSDSGIHARRLGDLGPGLMLNEIKDEQVCRSNKRKDIINIPVPQLTPKPKIGRILFPSSTTLVFPDLASDG